MYTYIAAPVSNDLYKCNLQVRKQLEGKHPAVKYNESLW